MALLDTTSSDFQLFLSVIRGGDAMDLLAGKQLERELDDSVLREAPMTHFDGVNKSLLFQKLPPEIRQHIWSYLVVVPESIHVYPVKGNLKQGFRLSRCGDARMNLTNGWCDCNTDGLRTNPNPPAYLDTELLLVSKTVRREVLDVVFLQNHFTFTSLRDLVYFSENFCQSAARLQNIRLLARLSDSSVVNCSANNVSKARRRIGHLQSLSLYAYLDGFNFYETYHFDGFISDIIHFAFPTVEDFTCQARPSTIWGTDDDLQEAARIVQEKLEDVFTGKWSDVKSVPLADPPPRKVPEREVSPAVKRGILALGD